MEQPQSTTWCSTKEGTGVGPQVIFGLDTAGRCTLSVGSGLAALGFRPGEMVGKDLFAFFREDPLVRQALDRVLTGDTFQVEREYGGRLLSTYYQPVHDESGTLTGAIGVSTDVTDQRRAEREADAARRRAYHLADLSVALTSQVLDLPELLKVAVRAVTEVAAELGVLWLEVSPGERLVPAAAWNGSDPEPGPFLLSREDTADRYECESSTVATLIRPRSLDLFGDAEAAASQRLLRQMTRNKPLQATLRVPLRSRGELIGMVDIARTMPAEPFSDEDVDLIADIAQRCALAIDNALLLDAHRVARQELVKFKALADASNNLIGISDPADRLVYVSPSAVAAGVRAEGMNVWSALATYAGEEQSRSMRAQRGPTGRWSGQLALQIGEGRVAHLEVFCLRHPDDGSALGTAWVAQDITDLRAAEAALRLANADLSRFKALVEASPDFIAIADLDGHVQSLNPGGREMIGLGADVDVTSTTIADYLTPEGLAASVQVEQPAVVQRGHWEGESTLRNYRGGPPVPVAIASFLMRDPDTGEPFALATVQRDITDRLAAQDALRELAEQRGALLTRLVDAQETERSRIAADVHDDTVQACAAVDLRLGLLRRRIRAQAPDLLAELDEVQISVSEATDRLRVLLFDLEPPNLSQGLAPALVLAAQEIFETTTVRCTVDGGAEPDMPEATRAIAYRISKEALVNVRKHAGARHVGVTLSGIDDGLEITIRDDGVGPGSALERATPGHLGISGMRDRATLAGGRCTIAPGRDGGTCVSMWLPGPR